MQFENLLAEFPLHAADGVVELAGSLLERLRRDAMTEA